MIAVVAGMEEYGIACGLAEVVYGSHAAVGYGELLKVRVQLYTL